MMGGTERMTDDHHHGPTRPPYPPDSKTGSGADSDRSHPKGSGRDRLGSEAGVSPEVRTRAPLADSDNGYVNSNYDITEDLGL